MKKFIGYGLVGLAGYFVGFYEFKYKMIKSMLEAQLKEEGGEKKNEE